MKSKVLSGTWAAVVALAAAAIAREIVRGDPDPDVLTIIEVALIWIAGVAALYVTLELSGGERHADGEREPIGPQTPAAIADRDAQLDSDIVARIAPYGVRGHVGRRDDSVSGCLRRLSADIAALKRRYAPAPSDPIFAAAQSEINQALRALNQEKHMAEQFLTNKQVAQIAFEAAGAASAPFMQDHPHYVFPSERVSAGVDQVLLEHGIDVALLEGYGSVIKARERRAERAMERAAAAREFGDPAPLKLDDETDPSAPADAGEPA